MSTATIKTRPSGRGPHRLNRLEELRLRAPIEAALLVAMGSNVGLDFDGNEYPAGPITDHGRILLGAYILHELAIRGEFQFAAHVEREFARRWPNGPFKGHLRFSPKGGARE